jgi:hypothetical protein
LSAIDCWVRQPTNGFLRADSSKLSTGSQAKLRTLYRSLSHGLKTELSFLENQMVLLRINLLRINIWNGFHIVN